MTTLIQRIILLSVMLSSSCYAMTWKDFWWRKDQQGMHLLQANKPLEAADTFESPHWRAVANYKAKKYSKALQTFSQTKDATSYYNAGNALALQGEYEKAIAAYDAALKQTPTLQDAIYNRELVKKLLQQEKQQDKKQDKDKNKEQDKNDKKDKKDNQTPKEPDKDKQQDEKTPDKKDQQDQDKQPKPQDSQQDKQKQQPQEPNQDEGPHEPNKPKSNEDGTSQKQQPKEKTGSDKGQSQDQKQDKDKDKDKDRDKDSNPNDNKKGSDQKPAKKQPEPQGEPTPAQPKPGGSSQGSTQPMANHPMQQAGGAQKQQAVNAKQKQLDAETDQWLEQVADNPGTLLQRKIMRDHLLKSNRGGEN